MVKVIFTGNRTTVQAVALLSRRTPHIVHSSHSTLLIRLLSSHFSPISARTTKGSQSAAVSEPRSNRTLHRPTLFGFESFFFEIFLPKKKFVCQARYRIFCFVDFLFRWWWWLLMNCQCKFGSKCRTLKSLQPHQWCDIIVRPGSGELIS